EARRGVDAHDPERAEVALLEPAVAVGVDARLVERLLGDPVGVALVAVVPARLGEYLLPALSAVGATLDECHGEPRFLVGAGVSTSVFTTGRNRFVPAAVGAAGLGLQHLADVLLELPLDRGHVAQLALPLAALLGEDVAVHGVAAQHLPRGGDLEALARSAVALHLGH